MPLIPWKPFGDFDRFFEDSDWFLPVFRGSYIEPAMDVYETDKEVVAEINLPDIDPEKVEISVEDGVLSVKGEMEEKKEEKKKGYWRKEIRRGSFARAVHLPSPVKKDEAKAVYRKGVLRVTMPKAGEEKPEKKKIKIETQ